MAKTKKKKILILGLAILILSECLLLSFAFKKFDIQHNFTINGDENIEVEYGTEYLDEGFLLKGDYDQYKEYVSINSDVDNSKLGEYKIVYNLDIDSLNVKKKIYRKINIVDTLAPVIELSCADEIYVDLNSDFKIPDYKASDNYDGDLTGNVITTSNVDTTKEGEYTVLFEVSDSSNNETKKELKVIVQEKFKHTYIQISISNQKLKYYVNNNVVLESDVVTGLNNWTPKGDFSVLSKSQNTYLVGANYRSFVRYWMAFKGTNYGMHDASWRNSFGGNIYKTNGSHGCVNMPYDKVKELYELVEVGTPVYIED